MVLVCPWRGFGRVVNRIFHAQPQLYLPDSSSGHPGTCSDPGSQPRQEKKNSPPAANEQNLDLISKQAAVLEADLAKLNSSSKAGGEQLLKIIDLYYDNGRPFGLVRFAQTFIGLHTTHPRHKDVMLKLIDGLQTTGRNKELIATGRQFLTRHPADPAGADIERWLARLLQRTNDLAGTTAVLNAHWQRVGMTADGPRAAREAIQIYFAINSPDSLAKAAVLGESLLDKASGRRPCSLRRFGARWTLTNVSAPGPRRTLLPANFLQSPPTHAQQLQTLHARMGENYSRLSQRVNAVESWRKAIAVANLPPRP